MNNPKQVEPKPDFEKKAISLLFKIWPSPTISAPIGPLCKPIREALQSAYEAGRSEKRTPTHRHKKRGTEYTVIGEGKMQADYWQDGYGNPIDMAPVIIYRGTDGDLWARPKEEFEDGRFELLPLQEKTS